MTCQPKKMIGWAPTLVSFEVLMFAVTEISFTSVEFTFSRHRPVVRPSIISCSEGHYLSRDFFQMTTQKLLVLTSTGIWEYDDHKKRHQIFIHVCITEVPTKVATLNCVLKQTPLNEATNICPKMTTSMPVPNVPRLDCSTEAEHK